MAKILVVDDDASIRVAVSRLLRIYDHEVVLAVSAEEALSFLERGDIYDLIISDLNMGGMSGINFFRHIGQDARFMNMPRILHCTDASDKDIINLCEVLNVIPYKKGNPSDSLPAVVENALQKK